MTRSWRGPVPPRAGFATCSNYSKSRNLVHPAKNDQCRQKLAQLRAFCAVLGEGNAGFPRLRTLRVRKGLRKVHAKVWTTLAPALRRPSRLVGALAHPITRQTRALGDNADP
jgi:hypothetical protein